MTQNPKPMNVSFMCPWHLYKRIEEALPEYGDRSRVLRALIKKYLNGEVIIQIQPKGVKPHANSEVLTL